MKNAVLAIVTDLEGGMIFNNRRQMKDIALIEKIVSRFGEERIYISPFSARLFANFSNVTVCDDPISSCTDGSLCFIEEPELLSGAEDIETVAIYNWGVEYPADKYFTLDLRALGFKKISKEKLKTAAHGAITLEVYKKI